MADVVDLGLFRDRRNAAASRLPTVTSEFANKAELHAHLLTHHAYGGPKSNTRERLEIAHRNRHDGIEMGTPHTHA
jgi:hypothetical protein